MANEVYKSGRSNPNRYKKKKKRSFYFTVAIIAFVIIFAFIIDQNDKNTGHAWENLYEDASLIESTPEIVESELSVYYLDVGQSDCSILCNEGQVLMIDTGIPSELNTVREALQSLGIKKIDYLLITHQHDDHMGNAESIIRLYDVANIIMPKLSAENMVTTRAYENLLTAIKEKQVHAVAAEPGLTFNIGNAKCMVLAPFQQDKNLNNMSAVTKVTFGNNSFLFEGDAEKTVESQILAHSFDVSADVIKVGHHGSKTSSSKRYISAVSPKMAVISCGKVNSYGHPHADTLNALKEARVDTYVTFETGLLTAVSDGNKITVQNSSGVIKVYE